VTAVYIYSFICQTDTVVDSSVYRKFKGLTLNLQFTQASATQSPGFRQTQVLLGAGAGGVHADAGTSQRLA
jgi:hypothetical protein